MRRLRFLFLSLLLSFAFTFCGKTVFFATAESDTVYVGGMSAGFTLKSGGAQIIGLCEVLSDGGMQAPALQSGLKTGDKIVSINGISIGCIEDLNKLINESNGKAVKVETERGNETHIISVIPAKDKISGKYKIGILARDSVSGIGTVTYITKNRRFGSLGHSVVGENKKELRISDGTVYECNIIGVSKGIRGKAGELRGAFLNDKPFGSAEKLCSCGIFGTISEDIPLNTLTSVSADSNKATPGKAYIFSTVDGVSPQKYEIEIVKVDKFNKENKNFVIKITDDELISQTGGIVQGMSGSPILQNGKLIGAITHVFLNDPTRGYGIDIQTMLQE
ncbi:MAG: PDZ domain-containing protein [Clostridia bacterium]|nr:PDZ domain-containing protein [Clostridia bacterium]